MKINCDEMRRRIAGSIGWTVEPEERDAIERHCAECEPCRMYRDRLLRDDARLAELAAPCADSVKRVQERAMARVRSAGEIDAPHAAAGAISPRGSRSSGIFARIPRIAAFAAAAAIIIAVILLFDLLRGVHNGPVPAFAAVQEKIQKAHMVVFRVDLWQLGQWTTIEAGRTSSKLSRKDYGDSIIVSNHPGTGEITELRLWPAEKRAEITRIIYPPSKCDTCRSRRHNPVDFLATWHKMKGFAFVRKERLNGVNTAVYERCPNPHRGIDANRMTAWVDLDTQLPVRFEIASPRIGPNDGVYSFGLQLNDFVVDKSKPTGWVEIEPGEPCTIYSDFRWNSLPDSSYFSLTPPASYAVHADTIRPGFVDSCVTKGSDFAEHVARMFSKWLDLSGNVFPDDLAGLDDPSKIKPLLIAKYRRGGVPAEEYRAAKNAIQHLPFGSWIFRRMAEQRVALHYAGKDAVFGDAKRIVCWLEDGNEPPCPGKGAEGPYYIIYGDLRVAASRTPPKIGGE